MATEPQLVDGVLEENSEIAVCLPGVVERSITPYKVDELSTGGQILVWSMRVWLRICRGQASLGDPFSSTYENIGLPGAKQSIERIMGLLAKIAIRPIHIECTCQSHLSNDEFRLVRIFQLLQARDYQRAQRMTQRFIKAPLDSVFCQTSEEYAIALRGAKLEIQHRPMLALVPTQNELKKG